MKKIIFLVSLVAFSSSLLYAQSNNPYNQKGLDFWLSVKMIKDDFNAGKVKDFNQQSLDYYTNIIPLKKPANAETVGLDLVASVLKEMKNPNFDLNAAIESSNFSITAKNDFKEILNIQRSKSGSESFISKVEEIKNQKISTNEKEILLTLVSIYSNMNNEIGATGLNRLAQEDPAAYWSFIAVGTLVGSAFGPWGALIGGGIMAIAGQLS